MSKKFKKIFLIILFLVLNFHLVHLQAENSVKDKINIFLQVKKIFQAHMQELENLADDKKNKFIFDARLETTFYKYLGRTLKNILLYLDWLIETTMLENMLGDRKINIIFYKNRLKILDEMVLESCLYSMELVISNSESAALKKLCWNIEKDIKNLRETLLKAR